jgi:hypothetical protein
MKNRPHGKAGASEADFSSISVVLRRFFANEVLSGVDAVESRFRAQVSGFLKLPSDLHAKRRSGALWLKSTASTRLR